MSGGVKKEVRDLAFDPHIGKIFFQYALNLFGDFRYRVDLFLHVYQYYSIKISENELFSVFPLIQFVVGGVHFEIYVHSAQISNHKSICLPHASHYQSIGYQLLW